MGDINGAVLSIYFSRLFPFDYLFRWLSYGDEKNFSRREFAFNFEGERFLRNQAYKNGDELKRHMKKFRPVKVDIGAVYNTSPMHHLKETNFHVVQKELMFDIDVTDYDEVRTCCAGADICCKCWKFMTLAVKILDVALRDDFGFKHILWVFSGRRGIHCWVCDKRARFLRGSGRYGVANYLQLITGGEYKKKKVEIINQIHPSVKRALKFIEPLFLEMCVIEQNMLGTEERMIKFLGLIAEEMRTEVKEVLDQYSTSESRWAAFVKYFKDQIELKSEEWCKVPFLIEEIMIQYAYPRLDIHVTLGMTHLLKSPFCVHPKSGKVGVPIAFEEIEKFDPDNVPTIMDLLKEIDSYDAEAKQRDIPPDVLQNVKDIEKTSLNQYLSVFKNFVHELEISDQGNSDIVKKSFSEIVESEYPY